MKIRHQQDIYVCISFHKHVFPYLLPRMLKGQLRLFIIAILAYFSHPRYSSGWLGMSGCFLGGASTAFFNFFED